jgi:glycerol-3-phosphate O-acyltransferase/dihydroxyacetone phosphate acyltransferase
MVIFPEGDTHDKIELLPLKVGICIAALGAMEKYGKPVTLVPCGMSFENQHKFRSKMTLEFGEPFKIPQSMIEQYRTNKSAAIATLFEST